MSEPLTHDEILALPKAELLKRMLTFRDEISPRELTPGEIEAHMSILRGDCPNRMVAAAD